MVTSHFLRAQRWRANGAQRARIDGHSDHRCQPNDQIVFFKFQVVSFSLVAGGTIVPPGEGETGPSPRLGGYELELGVPFMGQQHGEEEGRRLEYMYK
eukprot:scaffold1979_cov116-Isochrysis_galbana.AAC.2